MKRIVTVTSLLLLTSVTVLSQEKNGTIYISHPNIDAVNKAGEAYINKDDATMMQIYSDTAKVWASGMQKPVTIKEAMKMWDGDFDRYDSIKQKPYGYPDYLEYTKDDAHVVQSWWIWSGKSKKTGQTLKVPFVLFDDFNKDGKIVFESNYGDWSKLEK